MAAARMLKTMFHADLSDALPGEDYWVSVGDRRIPLVSHTDETRKQALAGAHLYAPRPDARLTHYAVDTIELPSDTVVRVHLRNSQKGFPDAKSETGVSHCAIWYPPAAHHLAGLAADATVHAPPINYTTTAQGFLFHHPDLINKDPELTKIIIENFMIDDDYIKAAINKMALKMRDLGPPTETDGWAILKPYTPPKNEETGFNGITVYYEQMPTQAVVNIAFDALKNLLIRVQNDAAFKDKKWNVEPGQAVVDATTLQSRTTGPVVPPMVHSATITTEGAAPESWTAALSNTNAISGCKTAIKIIDAKRKTLKVTIDNEKIRYLAAYIRFYDANGKAMKVPNWRPDGAGIAWELITAMGIQYDDVRYLGLLMPQNNVFAIPIPPPGTVEVQVTMPEGAVSASIYGSGIGVGDNPWPMTPAFGGILTGVMNLGVPAFMLAATTGIQSYFKLYKLVYDLTKNDKFIAAVATFVLGWAGYIGGSYAVNREMKWSSFTTLIQLLFSTGFTRVMVEVEVMMIGTKVAEQIPYAGWIMQAVNIAAGIAQLTQTIVAVATSSWNIENKLSTTITTVVKVRPDPRNKAFPQGLPGTTRTCTAKMIFHGEARPTVQQTIEVPHDTRDTELTLKFPNNTLGGQLKFEVDFFIDSWLAGKATTGFMDNDEKHAAEVLCYLVEYPKPITDKSIYKHAQILTYVAGSYGWTVTATAPTATIVSRNNDPNGNFFGDWNGIALSQRYGMLGPSWQAAGMGIADCDTGATGQLYAFQNINIPGTPMDAVKFPSCGFGGQSRLIYDFYPPRFLMVNGQWKIGPDGRPEPDPNDQKLGEYYVDPRFAYVPYDSGGGFHLRKVTLDKTTPFNMRKDQPSYGRFAVFPDSVTMHPSGLVIGVNAKDKKLQIVKLNKQGAADTDVPLGEIGSGPALDPARPGLMFTPVAVTCAYDGTIIVLEDTKSETLAISRLSAYDLLMNPVSRFFDESGNPSPWLYLAHPEDYHYLDVTSVGDEKMTYIYLLYYTGAGALPADYHMAIYAYGETPPKTNPLVVTDSIAAARLTVDMWRTAYTLNFAMVTDGKGSPAGPKDATTGPAGRTVPSVSMWLPPVPASSET